MLVTVVQRALDQNLDLAAAFARVRQARAAAAAAGAQLLPTADLEATGTAVHQSVVNPFGAAANGFPGYRRDQREYTVGAAASLCRKSFELSTSKSDLTCPHKAETDYENRVKLRCEHSLCSSRCSEPTTELTRSETRGASILASLRKPA